MRIFSGAQRKPLSKNKPKQLVVFLHGLGSNGDDLIYLADFFADILPDAQFLSPNAPFSSQFGYGSYQWFDLSSWEEDHIFAQLENLQNKFEQYVEQILSEFSLEHKDLLLIGFSQGTMTSLHIAPRMEKKIAGIIGFSGSLIKPEKLKAELKSKPDVLLSHGNLDEIVPYQAMSLAENELTKLGFKVEAVTQKNITHSISMEGIKAARDFISKLYS